MNSFVLQTFSDTGRCYKAAFSLVVVMLLCVWSQQNTPFPTLAGCLAIPSACDGKLLSTDAGGKVESVEAEGFWLNNGGQHIRVAGHAPDVRTGDTVFLEAIFHVNGDLELQQLYASRYRNVRIWVSLPAMAWVIWLFFRTYRFDFARRVLVRRLSSGESDA